MHQDMPVTNSPYYDKIKTEDNACVMTKPVQFYTRYSRGDLAEFVSCNAMKKLCLALSHSPLFSEMPFDPMAKLAAAARENEAARAGPNTTVKASDSTRKSYVKSSFGGPKTAGAQKMSKETVFLSGVLAQQQLDTNRINSMLARLRDIDTQLERSNAYTAADLEMLKKVIGFASDMSKMATTAYLNAAALPYALVPGQGWEVDQHQAVALFTSKWGSFTKVKLTWMDDTADGTAAGDTAGDEQPELPNRMPNFAEDDQGMTGALTEEI
jgi:hypothetical protein